MNLVRLRELLAAWQSGAIREAELNELRDALPEVLGRLEKLEEALGYAVTQLEGANDLLLEEEVRGEEDGVQDIRDWIHETRVDLLKPTR